MKKRRKEGRKEGGMKEEERMKRGKESRMERWKGGKEEWMKKGRKKETNQCYINKYDIGLYLDKQTYNRSAGRYDSHLSISRWKFDRSYNTKLMRGGHRCNTRWSCMSLHPSTSLLLLHPSPHLMHVLLPPACQPPGGFHMDEPQCYDVLGAFYYIGLAYRWLPSQPRATKWFYRVQISAPSGECT